MTWLLGSVGVALLLWLSLVDWLDPDMDVQQAIPPSVPGPAAAIALPPAFLQALVRTQGAHSTRSIKEAELADAQARHAAALAEFKEAKQALHAAVDAHFPD